MEDDDRDIDLDDIDLNLYDTIHRYIVPGNR